MSLELNQTHDKHSVDQATGWEIWKMTPGMGVRKGFPGRSKFIVVTNKGKRIGFKSLQEFETYKAQIAAARSATQN